MARSNLISRLWSALRPAAETQAPQGEQRPLSLQIATSLTPRNFDLEIPEYPVRDSQRGRMLIELWQYCPEVAQAIDILVGDVFASRNGRPLGFIIADDLGDATEEPDPLTGQPPKGTPVDPQVKDILMQMFERLNVLDIRRAVERSIIYGDAFLTFGIDSKTMQVSRLLLLPTWEVFRQEDDYGNLLGFEQRRELTSLAVKQQQQQVISLNPATTLHLRYRQLNLYGRSLFNESLEDWAKLKEAVWDLARAARGVGVNPNVHVMPEGADAEYLKSYRNDYESQQLDGVVTDIFQLQGGDVHKLANNNPDLKALVENVLMWRARIVMRSRVPMWYFPGLDTARFRDVSGQNQLGYERHIEDIRCLTEQTLRQMCMVELILKGVPPEKRRFRFEWPRIDSNVYNQVMQQNQGQKPGGNSVSQPNKPSQEGK